jgi:hypothetical protein
VYRDRLSAHRSAHARREQLNARLSYARLGVFLLGIVTAVIVWHTDLTPWILLVTVAAFLGLAAWHERVLRARDRAAAAIAYYEWGLARIEDRWIGTGEPGTRFRDAHHPYALDLDLFGEASVFELLSTARTREGEATLAAWLLAAAAPGEILARQQAVAELGPAVDLRERMAVAGPAGTVIVDAGALRAWAVQAPLPGLARLKLTAYAGEAATVAAALYWMASGSMVPLLIVFVLLLLTRYADSSRLEGRLHVASGKARELDTLGRLLIQVESAALSSPRVAAVRATVAPAPGQHTASRAIRALQRLAERHAWMHSLPLVPLGLFLYSAIGPSRVLPLALISASAVLLFTPLLALAVERWRDVHGRHVSAWMAALAEFEALAALATYHFEHPGGPFPVIETGGLEPRMVFDGTGLGHPLLPLASMVRNDVRLTGDTQLLVVSGSNMSGKSTLLRTIGVNAVLALAGAPVRAESLRLSPLAIGATLRIQDSLLEGRSRFFAEITRIRQAADLAAGPVPLLFLFDELLNGTNSHDRLVGAAFILRALLAKGAIGLITTHDLALTAIAGELAPRAVNVHFQDLFEGGEMRFDYRVKPGPVTRSNALALMRAVGLEVESPEIRP